MKAKGTERDSGEDETGDEHRSLSGKIQRLKLQEEILDKEKEHNTKEEFQIVQRLKVLKSKFAALEAEGEGLHQLQEMIQEQEIREKRLQYKIKEQREQEERIRLLQREEETLTKIEEMKQEEQKRSFKLKLN